MIRYSQCDPAWGSKMIGKSKTTICKAGCTLTALCGAASKFGKKILPEEAAKKWTFVKQGDDPEPHYLSWATKFEEFDFVWRFYDFENEKYIQELCESKTHAVVVQVQLKNGKQHWINLIGKSIIGWAADDPIDGRRLWSAWGPFGKYVRPMGYAVIKRK